MTPDAFARDMERVGLSASSPWDLVNMRESYPAAVPVLLKWLERADVDPADPDCLRFREGIVRSLAVQEARGIAGPALVREFHRPGVPAAYRWAVGNTLEVVATDEVFDERKVQLDQIVTNLLLARW